MAAYTLASGLEWLENGAISHTNPTYCSTKTPKVYGEAEFITSSGGVGATDVFNENTEFHSRIDLNLFPNIAPLRIVKYNQHSGDAPSTGQRCVCFAHCCLFILPTTH